MKIPGNIDIINISKRITEKIELLEKGRVLLAKRGRDKANATAKYELEIAKVLIGLKNGREYDLNGERIKDVPATIMEKIAKGICWNEKLEMDKQDALYKSAIVGMQSISQELNALQSLFRHLENM